MQATGFDGSAAPAPAVTTARIARLWWPLAASWLLMGAEMPLFVAAVSRLPQAEANLAAFGGLVFPIALLVEAPVIMLLAAATALVTDAARYRRLRRFTRAAVLAVTAVHAALAFTPLYDVLAETVIRLPDAAREPGRVGLRIMLPWAGAIAWRRFQQGVLIRAERSRVVMAGTVLRLLVNVGVLALGLALQGRVAGIVVGTAAIACGVVAEAVWVSVRARQAAARLPAREPGRPELTAARFLAFYAPLALTPFATLAVQPIGAAAIARMPEATASLAAWSAAYGLIFLLRAPGFAFQEVTVSLRGRPGGPAALARFGKALAAAAVSVLAVLWLTPLGSLWFGGLLGLPSSLAALGSRALGYGLALPALAVAQNHLQGSLVHAHRTLPVTAAVALYFAVAAAGYGAAVALQPGPGLLAAMVVLTVATAAQVLWLRRSLRRPP